MSEILRNFSPDTAGWLFMWILLVTAMFMVAIAVERVLFIRKRGSLDAGRFAAEIRNLVSRGEYDRALKLCEASQDKPLAHVLGAGLRKILQSKANDPRSIQNAVDEGALEVIPKLHERTGYLATIANVATLIGLMGTIYGLIIAFRSISAPGIDATEKARLLAAGISTAMNTTLLGLLIAVPAVLVYTYVTNRTTKMIDEIDEHTVKFINLIAERQ
ncbi:MAG: MotA/TolQ/ExbB proton channel family protein [candidate division KSB1 bacterium]|nr:MotA/TolQ/ExbB proton channel family protein [candidate division KSB1 bacterium]